MFGNHVLTDRVWILLRRMRQPLIGFKQGFLEVNFKQFVSYSCKQSCTHCGEKEIWDYILEETERSTFWGKKFSCSLKQNSMAWTKRLLYAGGYTPLFLSVLEETHTCVFGFVTSTIKPFYCVWFCFTYVSVLFSSDQFFFWFIAKYSIVCKWYILYKRGEGNEWIKSIVNKRIMCVFLNLNYY